MRFDRQGSPRPGSHLGSVRRRRSSAYRTTSSLNTSPASCAACDGAGWSCTRCASLNVGWTKTPCTWWMSS